MRRLLLALVVLAMGCAPENPDVCAEFFGRACIALEVRGSDDLLVDQLRIMALRGFLTTPFNNAPSPGVPVEDFHLPVILAVVPPQFFTGFYQLRVTAFRDAAVVAGGSVEGTYIGFPLHEEKVVELR